VNISISCEEKVFLICEPLKYNGGQAEIQGDLRGLTIIAKNSLNR